MKKLFCTVLAVMLLLAFGACKSEVKVDEDTFADGDYYEQIGGELNILNWGEYIDEAKAPPMVAGLSMPPKAPPIPPCCWG